MRSQRSRILPGADLLVEPVLQNVVVDVLVEVADVQLADDPGVPLVMAQPFLDVPFAVVRAAPRDGAQHEVAHTVHDAGLEGLHGYMVNYLFRKIVRFDDGPLFVWSALVNDDSLMVAG